jgi:hypothetical protein
MFVFEFALIKLTVLKLSCFDLTKMLAMHKHNVIGLILRSHNACLVGQ